jgi:Co/Zn/Cd efflux system component
MQEQLQKVEGVVDVHDLHIWDLRPGKTILIAHVFSRKGEETAVLKKLTDVCRKKRIYHSTFQVEED